MNTIAFGEEIVAEDVAADEVVTEEVVTDDVAEVAEEAAVEEAGEATLDEAELEDASLTATIDFYTNDGIAVDTDDKVATKIEYGSDGAKKNPVNSVATITNTTDPVSWNNFYAADLIETVIEGTDKEDEYLNNGTKVSVSENRRGAGYTADNQKFADAASNEYGSFKIEDGVYLLYKYGMQRDAIGSAYVAGYTGFFNQAGDGTDLAPVAYFDDDLVALNAALKNPADPNYDDALVVREDIVDRVEISKLPVVEWDGRKIAWDKDGKYDANKSMKESLVIKAALVKYENGTVTELNGVSVASVKIDAKAMKKASVEKATTQTKVASKYYDPTAKKDVDAPIYVAEHAVMNTLPTFTMTVKASGKDVKKYAKKIKTELKDAKFPFGIVQKGIEVNDVTEQSRFTTEYLNNSAQKQALAIHYTQNGTTDDKAIAGGEVAGTTTIKYYTDKKTNTIIQEASANEITTKDKDGVQDKLTEDYGEDAGYVSTADSDHQDAGDLKLTKFTVKNGKAKATVTDHVDVVKKGVDDGKGADITLKEGSGKDYTFAEESLAGEKVYTLTFEDKGNYVYAESDPVTTTTDLSAFGYKWAFRPSTVEKSKDFRRGIVAKTNIGFVFDAE